MIWSCIDRLLADWSYSQKYHWCCTYKLKVIRLGEMASFYFAQTGFDPKEIWLCLSSPLKDFHRVAVKLRSTCSYRPFSCLRGCCMIQVIWFRKRPPHNLHILIGANSSTSTLSDFYQRLIGAGSLQAQRTKEGVLSSVPRYICI